MSGLISKKFHDRITDPAKIIPDDKSDPLGLTDKPLGKTTDDSFTPEPPKPSPGVTEAQARLRQQREQEDAARRKRGRRSTLYTGDDGVGGTPVGRKTLVGS